MLSLRYWLSMRIYRVVFSKYLLYLYIFSFYDFAINWNCLSIFLDHWWDFSSFAYAITSLLSQYRAIGSTMLGSTTSLFMNFLIQISYFVPSNIEVYLTIIVESTLVSYLELFQLTTPLFRVKYNKIWFSIFNILLKTSIQITMNY